MKGENMGLECSTSRLRIVSIISVGKFDNLEEMGAHSRITLKWIMSKYSYRTRNWTGLK
jgi:hypothetical protein